MIRQCAILFGCLALGELVVFLTDIKLPSSIIGMLLLTLFLKLGWIKLQWVQGLSDFLVANLGFFFVPPGVALMLYFDIIAAQFWPIVIASLVSTLLGFNRYRVGSSISTQNQMSYLENEFFLLAVTFGVFFFSKLLQKKTGILLLNPILLTIAILIIFLKMAHISYETYNKGGYSH